MDKHLFHEQIFSWWREHGRVLPWREKIEVGGQVLEVSNANNTVREQAFNSYFAGGMQRDPYRVIVSELMLQQTQVDRVLPKYEAWMEKWPTILDLSQASLAEVLTEWKGLGYNRRARFLWLLAQEIVVNKKGSWPTTEEELIKLPGIGNYTARALLAFALGKHTGTVDTNIQRIFLRWNGEAVQPNSEKTNLFTLADEWLPEGQADPWNQALMDFGALICTSKTPKCEVCPVAQLCQSNVLAKDQGFENYHYFLTQFLIQQKKNELQRHKAKKIKFEESDRYIRGRIIDLLREKEWTEEDLLLELSQRLKLNDNLRNLKQLHDLMKEKLISKIGKIIRLG